ncbi:MAG: agmatine deiminase family protein, partial [Bacteroidota bacterium]
KSYRPFAPNHYYMFLPAEWEPHQLVLFTFPQQNGDWGASLSAVSQAMITAANTVNKTTPVLLIVSDAEHFALYTEQFKGDVLHIPSNDCWIRDYGPLCTWYEEDVLVLNHFKFNGWGGKFEAQKDDGVTQRLWRAEFPEAGYRRAEVILEGGAIESDGGGTWLTTKKCLLSEGRNNWTSTEAAESALREFFDIDHFLWLDNGELVGDDTDAHIDTLARFLDASTIAYVQCTDPDDEHYPSLLRMEEELKAFKTKEGQPYRLVPLPLPPKIVSLGDSRRLPATYTNFLISNGKLFLPTYFNDMEAGHPGKKADQLAIRNLQKFGTYQVVPIPSRSFIEQHGSLHCLTMQIPG